MYTEGHMTFCYFYCNIICMLLVNTDIYPIHYVCTISYCMLSLYYYIILYCTSLYCCIMWMPDKERTCQKCWWHQNRVATFPKDWLVLVCFNTIPWCHLRNQISLKCRLVLVVKLEHLRKLEKVRPVRDEGISMTNGVWVMTSSGRERWVWYADMSLLKNFALLSLQWNGMPKCLWSREAFDGSWFGGPYWSVVTLWLTVCCEAGVVGPVTGGRSYRLSMEFENCNSGHGLILNCFILSFLMKEVVWETWSHRVNNSLVFWGEMNRVGCGPRKRLCGDLLESLASWASFGWQKAQSRAWWRKSFSASDSGPAGLGCWKLWM